MIQNYFKIAIRNLARNKVYTVINIAGLAIGIAIAMIIALYLQLELTYDQYHEKHPQIFRVGSLYSLGDKVDNFSITSAALPIMMKNDHPEILNYVRLNPIPRLMIRYKDQSFYEDGIMFADSSMFQVFSHHFIHGSPEHALDDPETIVLTETFAQKYFGDINPVGEVIKTDNFDYKVTGVIEDVPENSHVTFDALISYNHLKRFFPSKEEDLRNMLWNVGVFTFFLMPEGFQPADFEPISEAFYNKHMKQIGDQLAGSCRFILEPLADVHFKSDLIYDRFPSGNISYVYAFIAIGIFILVLAAINYMNLATARSSKRSKEVGMRKVLGSSKKQLIVQFLGESVLLSLIAFILGIAIVELVLGLTPFNDLIQKNLTLDFGQHLDLILWALMGSLLLGVVAGSYPAFYLSSIVPINALKGAFKGSREELVLRKLLVVFQFIISIGVISCTLLMQDQIDYIRNKDLGFNKDNMLLVNLQDSNIVKKVPVIKSELLQDPEIEGVSVSSGVPGLGVGILLMRAEEDSGKLAEHTFNFMTIDHNYLATMKMTILEGRDFDKSISTDSSKAFIINEATARKMGWEDPIGKRMQVGLELDGSARRDGKVIGVVKDFNFRSLHEPLEPIVMVLQNQTSGILNIRIKGNNTPETMAHLEEKWGVYDPKHPFDYQFLDEGFNELYQADVRQSKLIGILSIICIFISCLGLLGLASFTIEQRTKEIGVRKVLGASISQIMYLLFKDVVVLIIIAAIIATPVAWYVIHKWLENFAYRNDISFLILGMAAVLAVVIAFITVSFHSFKAARMDPVRSLRYE